MIAELVRYARSRGLDTEAGFRSKRLRWVLLFDADGEFIDVLPQGEDKKGREITKCPHLQFSGDTPMRQFLVDTAEYLALLSEERNDPKLRKKHEFALTLLEKAAGAVPELGTIAYSLRQPQTIIAIGESLARVKAKSSDNVTLAMVRDGLPHIFVDHAGWQDWWRECWPTLFEGKKSARNASSARCLISGELCDPALTHPKIRNLGDVGGKVETALVLKQANSPTTVEATV
jgi:CRISPR-associated protein Csd1